MTTADLGTLAQIALARGDNSQARTHMEQLLSILHECGAEGPDYPQRDFLVAAKILHTLGEVDQANDALELAYETLQLHAGRILNESMREKYLNQIWFNKEILQFANALDVIA